MNVHTVTLASILLAASVTFAQEPNEPVPFRTTGMSIGGPTGKQADGFKVGDVVAFKDKKNPGEYIDGVVVRGHQTLEEKGDDFGGSYSKQRGYELIVPGANGESEVVFVDTNGNEKGRATMDEYVAGLKQQLAADLRNQITASQKASEQAAAAGQNLDKLNAKSKKLTDRYTTPGGVSRLATEIAIAVAVEKAGDALPKRYKGMTRSESALVNTLANAGIKSVGDAGKNLAKDPTADGVNEAAKAFGVTATAEVTFAPIIQQMVNSRQITPKQGEKALSAATALVKIGIAAGTAEDGEALEAAKKQALEELFDAGLPPGVGILARDATDMGLQIIEYGNVINEIRGANLNINNSADIAKRIGRTRRALAQLGELDARIHQYAKQQIADATIALPGAQPSGEGWNGGLDTNTKGAAATQPAPAVKGAIGAGMLRD